MHSGNDIFAVWVLVFNFLCLELCFVVGEQRMGTFWMAFTHYFDVVRIVSTLDFCRKLLGLQEAG